MEEILDDGNLVVSIEGAEELEMWFSPPAKHLGATPNGDMLLEEFLEMSDEERPKAWTNVEIDFVKLWNDDGWTIAYHAKMPNDNKWHHYCITCSPLTGHLTRYVDGVRVTKRQWRKRWKMPANGVVTGGGHWAWRSKLRRELHGYKVKTKRKKR